MSLIAITALRDAIKNDTALTVFWAAQYGKAVKHIIGYKRSANANDYPFVSLVPSQAIRGGQMGDKEIVSIVIGVNNPDTSDGVYDGVIRLADAETLLLAAIKPFIVGEARIITDLGERHPFYEKEITVQLRYRKSGKLLNSID